MPKFCEYDGCKITPTYGEPGGKKRFCTAHKLPTMIYLKKKMCEFAGCKTIPFFGNIGGKTRFCVTHKEPAMIDLITKRCSAHGCQIKNPNYDIPGGKGSYCKLHKLDGMTDVRTKQCKEDGCTSKPTYDVVGGSGTYCAKHKLSGMINVISKRCEYQGCSIVGPNYDVPGGKGRFCVTHKADNMIDVCSNKCIHEGCNTVPGFGLKGGVSQYCKKHKLKGMISIRNRICNYTDCSKSGRYGFNRKELFCIKHKEPGMTTQGVPECCVCYNFAYYGQPGKKAIHCKVHRVLGEIRRPKRRCTDCKNIALWGNNFIAKHCEIHKKEDETNMVERECSSCNLVMLLDDNNKCYYCNPSSFNKSRLVKQDNLMSYLDSRGLIGTTTDRPISDGVCGRERPDRVFDIGDKILIIECDENQHRERNCACEQARMVNIAQSFGGIPTYFIRWNPDDYEPGMDGISMETIKLRYKTLGDLIMCIIEDRIQLPHVFVSAFYMYYDGWSSIGSEKWQTLMTYDSITT